jgi:acyl-CoA reductase-like NAD-dependent aldehyde dehydrogenase
MLGFKFLKRSGSTLASPSFQSLYGPFVNGRYELPGQLESFPVHSPATLDHLCNVKSADADYVAHAVDIAHQTFESGVWSRSDVRLRADVLNKIAASLRTNIPRLAQLEVAQTGRAIKSVKNRLSFDNLIA